MKILQTEYNRTDKRGSLTQIHTGNFRQLNYLVIKEDNSFGDHYHKAKHEVFYVVSGMVLLETKNIETKEFHSQIFSEGAAFLIEPYDNHIITAINDSTLIETLSEPYDQGDVYE